MYLVIIEIMQSIQLFSKANVTKIFFFWVEMCYSISNNANVLGIKKKNNNNNKVNILGTLVKSKDG